MYSLALDFNLKLASIMSLIMPDFLKKESIVPVKKLQDFTFLNRDEFLADHDVDALAKREARVNLPATSAMGMDANELTLIQQLTQAATAATHTLNNSLADIAKGILTIDVASEKAELDSAVNKIEAELKKEYSSQVAYLDELKNDAELRQEDVQKFKKDNRLRREASYKDSYGMLVATILLALVIETTLNSSLLADASDFGLFGGASQAIIISLINIILGLVIGMAIYPKINHIDKAVSSLGYIFLILGGAFVLVFNLLIGHYREVLIDNPDDSGVAAVKQFSEGMFNLTEIESIFLVVIGLLVSGLSCWKGMIQNDKYPGYSHVSKQCSASKDRLYVAKEDVLNELNNISEECVQGLKDLLKKVSLDYSRCTTLFSTYEQQQKLYESYTYDLGQTGVIAISRYRQVNRSNRGDGAPDYFDEEVFINFNQKPVIPKIPDIKSSLNEVVDDFGSRIPGLEVELLSVVDGYRKKIVEIEL